MFNDRLAEVTLQWVLIDSSRLDELTWRSQLWSPLLALILSITSYSSGFFDSFLFFLLYESIILRLQEQETERRKRRQMCSCSFNISFYGQAIMLKKMYGPSPYPFPFFKINTLVIVMPKCCLWRCFSLYDHVTLVCMSALFKTIHL